jgi:DNA-binding PadR family transcriptional regulator
LGIKPGSLYPILMRLADRGFLETTWEADPQPGRPPRHLYRLTGAGVALAAELADAAAEPTAAPAARAGSLRRVAPTTRPAGAMP